MTPPHLLSCQHLLLVASRADSCGFEHVFVGETKHGQEITGLHNWVQFYLQEKHGHIDYKGHKARDNKNTVRQIHTFIIATARYRPLTGSPFIHSPMRTTTCSTCSLAGRAWSSRWAAPSLASVPNWRWRCSPSSS